MYLAILSPILLQVSLLEKLYFVCNSHSFWALEKNVHYYVWLYSRFTIWFSFAFNLVDRPWGEEGGSDRPTRPSSLLPSCYTAWQRARPVKTYPNGLWIQKCTNNDLKMHKADLFLRLKGTIALIFIKVVIQQFSIKIMDRKRPMASSSVGERPRRERARPGKFRFERAKIRQ